MKTTDYASKDESGLKKDLESLLREQFNLRMQKATGQLGQSHRLGQVRKDIARVKTALSKKAKGNS